MAVLPSLSLSPSFQPMTKFSLSVGGRGRPCIIRRQSRSVGGARRGNAIDSIFNVKGAVTEGKLKQRVDRAQNGRGTFILSRRHWQGKQEDLLITFALQLRSLLSSLSPTLSLSPSPSFSPSLRSSSPFHIVECSRIRQHACDIPVPVGICLSFINANKAIIVDEWRGRLDIPLMARCRIRRGYPRSDVSMASNRSPTLFFFFQRAMEQATIDLGCREPSPSFQNGVGWEKSCNDRRNFRIYLAHGPSKQLLNISGTDNTSAEGKQRVVVFRRRNNPSQIKTRKQTRERDAERARVRKLAFTLPSPRLSSPSRS